LSSGSNADSEPSEAKESEKHSGKVNVGDSGNADFEPRAVQEGEYSGKERGSI
jgi:hypothetical protein